jgi:hypothetical protein
MCIQSSEQIRSVWFYDVARSDLQSEISNVDKHSKKGEVLQGIFRKSEV